MNDRTYVVVDANYLCHRNFHAFKNTMSGEMLDGTVYGFLRDIIQLKDELLADRMVLCFDTSNLLRAKSYPNYKLSRKEKKEELSEEERNDYQGMYQGIEKLQSKILPYLGYQNILYRQGYEADDMIAKVIQWGLQNDPKAHYHIVSSDTDLYQLLRRNVTIYKPGKGTYTINSLLDEFNVTPDQYIRAKAIAGDTSDNVQGVSGVGVITAIKYLRGELKPGSTKHTAIEKADKVIRRNIELMVLPFEGTPDVEVICDDEFDRVKWKKALNKLGMVSLLKELPHGD